MKMIVVDKTIDKLSNGFFFVLFDEAMFAISGMRQGLIAISKLKTLFWYKIAFLIHHDDDDDDVLKYSHNLLHT